MIDDTGRRRFLQLAGTGTALSVAGCNAFQSDGEDGDGGPDLTGDGAKTTVTLAVQPDEEKLQQRQSEIQSEVQSENMSRMEASQVYRQRVQEARTELTKAAANTFNERVTEDSPLTIEDSIDRVGVFQVTGTAESLIGTLSYEEVRMLLAQSTFEEVQSQSQSQTPEGTATEEQN